MAVIPKKLAFQHKSEEEKRRILSILNSSSPISKDVSERLNQLSKMTESLIKND